MLEDQRDYQKANGESQAARGQKALKREESRLETVGGRAEEKREAQTAELKELDTETSALEEEVRKLKDSYNEQFTAWYTMKEELPAKLARLAGCECKGVMAASASLLAHGRQLAPKAMYDLVQKVEACETKNIGLTDEIDAERTKTMRATIAASDGLDTVDRKKAETTRMAKLMDKKPRVEALKGQKKALQSYTDSESEQVEAYKKKNTDLRSQLDDLDKQITQCGC